MSVFSEAIAAVEALEVAKEKAAVLYKEAKTEMEKLDAVYGTKLDKEKLGKMMDLVKKYAPMALKYFGMGTGGLAVGGLLENSGILSSLFSFLPF